MSAPKNSDDDEKPAVNCDANDSLRRGKRRRMRDEIFGDELPETTSDERGEDHSRRSRGWYESHSVPRITNDAYMCGHTRISVFSFR